MKTYRGSDVCRRCGKEFKWVFHDDGHRPGMGSQTISQNLSHNEDEALLGLRVYEPGKFIILTAHCPHCQAPIHIECNEHKLKEIWTEFQSGTQA